MRFWTDDKGTEVAGFVVDRWTGRLLLGESLENKQFSSLFFVHHASSTHLLGSRCLHLSKTQYGIRVMRGLTF